MYYYGNFYRVNSYERQEASKYALNYSLMPNETYRYFGLHGDGGGDCTNFISQCLKAGGSPFAYDSSPWWYRKNIANRNNDTWSVSWAVAHSLYWTLKVRGQSRASGLKAVEVQNIEELELGDLIQYENYKGLIYHSTIVTNFTNEGGRRVPLISQHTYDARNISYIKPAAKKMHFMKIEVS